VLIEDTPELQCACDGAVPMQTWHEVSMATLLRTSLRLAPTRIVVGEVRGAEASVLLNAWNTGHSGGVCSIHADSALLGLRRVEQMCREGGDQPWREYIASSVHVVCFISKRLVFGEDGVHRSWRRVEEVLWVRGLDKQGEYVCESVTG
jgi:type IV secretion system protein VirB11